METNLVLSIVLAIAEATAIYLLTEKSISFKGWKKVSFFGVGLFYVMCNVPNIFGQVNRSLTKIILIFSISFIYLIFTKGKEIWGLAWFYCNILIE